MASPPATARSFRKLPIPPKHQNTGEPPVEETVRASIALMKRSRIQDFHSSWIPFHFIRLCAESQISGTNEFRPRICFKPVLLRKTKELLGSRTVRHELG
jgi:hypothetical protein